MFNNKYHKMLRNGHKVHGKNDTTFFTKYSCAFDTQFFKMQRHVCPSGTSYYTSHYRTEFLRGLGFKV